MHVKFCIRSISQHENPSSGLTEVKVTLKDNRELLHVVTPEISYGIYGGKTSFDDSIYLAVEEVLHEEAITKLNDLKYWIYTGGSPVKCWQAEVLKAAFGIIISGDSSYTKIQNYPMEHYLNFINEYNTCTETYLLKEANFVYSKDENEVVNLEFLIHPTIFPNSGWEPLGYTYFGISQTIAPNDFNHLGINNIDKTSYKVEYVKGEYLKGYPKEVGFTDSRKDLIRLIPNINTAVKCPACTEEKTFHIEEYPLGTMIIILNDRHHWTREQIADWLEVLDLDLNFKGIENG